MAKQAGLSIKSFKNIWSWNEDITYRSIEKDRLITLIYFRTLVLAVNAQETWEN